MTIHSPNIRQLGSEFVVLHMLVTAATGCFFLE